MINAKNIIYFLCFLFISVQPHKAVAQDSKNGMNSFSIKGVSQVKFGLVALEYFDGRETHFDTTKIRNGRFVFKGLLNEAGQAILSILHNGSSEKTKTNRSKLKFYFILEPLPLTVKLDTSNGLPDISGAQSQEDFYKLKLERHAILKEGNLLNDRALQLVYKQQAGDSSESLKSQITKIFETLNAYQERDRPKLLMLDMNFIETHPASILSAFIIDEYQNILPIDTVSSLYDKLHKNVQNSNIGKQLGTRIRLTRNLEVGRQAPDFRAVDSEGNLMRLSDFTGNYVLLDFWASWCAPCREVAPQIAELHQMYQPKLKLISVSLDADKEAWIKAMKEDRMERWTNLRENGNVRKKETDITFIYDIQPIPAYVLIDDKGKIVYRGKGTDAVNEIKNLLTTIFK